MAEEMPTATTVGTAQTAKSDPTSVGNEATLSKINGTLVVRSKLPAPSETVVLDPRGDLFVAVYGTDSLGNDEPVRFQVCSRALARASKVFDAMLFGEFAESAQSRGAGEWNIELLDDAAVPMRLLFGVMHGRFQKTHHIDLSEPGAIPKVYDLLVAADKYDAIGLTKPWAKIWLSDLKPDLEDQLELLCASWIYYQLGSVSKYTDIVTRLILDFSPDSITFGAEIPDFLPPTLSDTVLQSRINMIRSLRGAMTKVMGELLSERRGSIGYCSRVSAAPEVAKACEQLILGRLLCGLTAYGFWFNSSPKSEKSYSPGKLAVMYYSISGPGPKNTLVGDHERCCVSRHLQKYITEGQSKHQPSYSPTFSYTPTDEEVKFMEQQMKITGLDGVGFPDSD